MKRLQERLHATRHGALSIYLASGHPDRDRALAVFEAAIEGGADWIELGIPFSDPGADGPTIEAATAAALAAGHHVEDAFALATTLTKRHPDTPLIAMTYANIAYQMGWDAFARRCAEAGIDGVILPDVPLEESEPVRDALATAGVAWVPLVTPATDAKRMAAIAATCTGFLYVVGNVGITGQADPGPLVEATVRRARDVTDKPLAVGFGIASANDVARVIEAGAQAAIVGSHIVQQVHAGATPDAIRAAVAALRSKMPGQGS